MEMRLEVVPVPVTDVDRAKAFYVDKVGFNADHDHIVSPRVRFVQLTPPGSACSIVIGVGVTADMAPGSLRGLMVVVAGRRRRPQGAGWRAGSRPARWTSSRGAGSSTSPTPTATPGRCSSCPGAEPLRRVGRVSDQLGVLGGALDRGFASLRERPTPRDERYELGRALRKQVPRSSLGDWAPPDGRSGPVDQIVASHDGRVPWLVPVRVGRMAASPYAFLRGTAGIMAADFAALPATGITPVVCGDAHLGNFGFYASPERELVFDLNDFDEAHPGAGSGTCAGW